MRPISVLPILLAALACSGCKYFSPTPEREPDAETVSDRPIVADCRMVEFDNLSQEVTETRERPLEGVRFLYAPTTDVAAQLKPLAPRYLFVISHGWMNNTGGAREFTAEIVRALADERRPEAVPAEEVAFIGVSWNSERAIFHESALNAEAIGRLRISPMLGSLRAALPETRITVVGHSLGARLMLAALQGDEQSPTRLADGAVLIEGAVDCGAIVPGADAALFGIFPRAPTRVSLLANVHSANDDVLRLAYQNAMNSPALGRDGALRDAEGTRFPSLVLAGVEFDPIGFAAALAEGGASLPECEARVVNVDATTVVSGHTEFREPAVFDLVWEVAQTAGASAGGK